MHLECTAVAAILAVLAFGLGHYLGYRAANVEVYARLKRIADKQVQP
jgi:hypothetical protein